MRIVLADDEENALEALENILIKIKKNAEIKTFLEPEELIEYAQNEEFDVAFLDVEMGTMSGIEVAKALKQINPKVNVIFVTGYSKYMKDAFKLHVSGFVSKPATKTSVEEELNNLRNPIIEIEKNVLELRCFGKFEALVNGEHIQFERKKTLELLAYLTEKNGEAVTAAELRDVLWENEEAVKDTNHYLQKLKKDLIDSLEKAGVADSVNIAWNKYSIDTSKVYCDLYDYLNNKAEGIMAYKGEYMSGYSWAIMPEN